MTDDTHMTLFTAEGILRATASGAVGLETVPGIYGTYLRWLETPDRKDRYTGG